MSSTIPVYLEVGSRRVFAGALDWPGWCRSGRDEEAALRALRDYGARYKKALRRSNLGFEPPSATTRLDIRERLTGNATTDFGAPGIPPAADAQPADAEQTERLTTILEASWAALDRAAAAATGVALRKGPRGGGRSLDAIVSHVLEAERAYLTKLGGSFRNPAGGDVDERSAGLREAVLASLDCRTVREPVPRSSARWTPRYFVRRAAWHALDHAWEIEDRATTGAPR